MSPRPLTISASLLALLLPFVSFGQRSGIGIKGGVLMSDTRSAKVTTNVIPGATAGFYFPLRAGERLEVQPELLVTSLGAGYTLPDGDRSSVRTLYVQLPVCAKVYIGNAFNVQAGFLVGRLMLAQQSTPDGKDDVTDSYNTWDHGIVLGVGADLISGLDLGLRYYGGMRSVLADDDVLFPHNRAYMLTAGYRFARLRAPKFTKSRR